MFIVSLLTIGFTCRKFFSDLSLMDMKYMPKDAPEIPNFGDSTTDLEVGLPTASH